MWSVAYTSACAPRVRPKWRCSCGVAHVVCSRCLLMLSAHVCLLLSCSCDKRRVVSLEFVLRDLRARNTNSHLHTPEQRRQYLRWAVVHGVHCPCRMCTRSNYQRRVVCLVELFGHLWEWSAHSRVHIPCAVWWRSNMCWLLGGTLHRRGLHRVRSR